MGKCNKETSGVGNYLKYGKERYSVGELPNALQHTQPKIGEECQRWADCDYDVCYLAQCSDYLPRQNRAGA